MGNLDDVEQRAVDRTAPHTQQLADLIVLHVEATSTLERADATLADVEWPSKGAFADVTHEESLIGNLYGRLEVAMLFEGFTFADWTMLPPKEAIEKFKRKAKKLLTRKQFDKLSDKLKARAFTVAHLQHDYQLAGARDVLTEAITKGYSRGQTVKLLREKFESMGVTSIKRHHLETVHSTNILGSHAHGKWEQMKRLRGLTYWQYSTIGDRRVRPTHQEQDGKIYPRDHVFWSTWYPPNGFRCRCTVWPLSRAEALAEGVEENLPKTTPDKGFASSPADAVEPITTTPK
ncbi:MAG TPA: hypothetical protein ENL34_00640, partial [Chloroflexi bacterium]|nr:hypothetical protein [Chloroflexota bacterium]